MAPWPYRSSPRRHTGCPALTAATSELVVPRSMPTARPLQASLTRDWPGSAISNSASTGGIVGRLLIVQRDLVQEALEVADRDQTVGGGREVAAGERARDGGEGGV